MYLLAKEGEGGEVYSCVEALRVGWERG